MCDVCTECKVCAMCRMCTGCGVCIGCTVCSLCSVCAGYKVCSLRVIFISHNRVRTLGESIGLVFWKVQWFCMHGQSLLDPPRRFAYGYV